MMTNAYSVILPYPCVKQFWRRTSGGHLKMQLSSVAVKQSVGVNAQEYVMIVQIWKVQKKNAVPPSIHNVSG